MWAQRFLTSLERRIAWSQTCVVTCALLGAPPAGAQSRTLDLSLIAPEECGSADRLRGAVEELVHQTPREPLPAALTIRHVGDGYFAELRTGAAAVREVSAPSCEAVVEAATVILALAIDPSAERRAPLAPRAVPESEPKASAAQTLHMRAGFSSTVDTSILPHVASGARVRAGVSKQHWSAELELTYWLPATGWSSEASSLGGRFTWWTVGASGCLAPLPAARSLSLCVTPELGRLQGTGLGGRTNSSANAAWLDIALAPELGLAVTRYFVLRASAGAAITILGSHPFVLERSGAAAEVHRPARVSARGGLGFDLIF